MTKLQRALPVTVALLILGSSAGPGQASRRSALFAEVKPGNRVEVIDPATGRRREIYRSQRWSARRIAVSPRGDRISLLELDQGRIEGVNYSAPPQSELIVMDTTGTVVRRVGTNVQRYVWCGDSCLACIVGRYSEGDFGFSPESAYVVDLVTGAARHLKGDGRPIDLAWTAFDSSVLVKVIVTAPGMSTVYRYDVSTGTYSPTRYRDIHFSASGEYYFHAPDLADEKFRLFNARTNQEVRIPELVTIGTPLQWTSSGPNRLLVARREKPAQPRAPDHQPRLLPTGPREEAMEYAEFDLDSRRVVRTLRGHVPRWAAPAGVVPFVTSDGRIHAITHP